MLLYEVSDESRQSRSAHLLGLIRHAQMWLPEMDDMGEVDGCGNQHEVAGNGIDGVFQFLYLRGAITHRGNDIVHMWVIFVRFSYRAHRIWFRVNDLGCAELSGRDHSGPVRHLAVCYCRSVFDD